MNIYHSLLKNFLFLLPPEVAHSFTLNVLKICHQLGLIKEKKILAPRKIMGLEFPNPIGLAAGLDKNGDYIDALAALGFGFIEIGTVTPRPQPGNPKPRLFRLPQAYALINRLGFNNHGVDYLIQQVKKSSYKGILGINIGKNFDTPLEKAVDDYLFCMRKIYPYASYITVNISSPNTPGLRDLHKTDYFHDLLNKLKIAQSELHVLHQKYIPLVIKVSPDLSQEEIYEFAHSCQNFQVDGVIATNTTVSREGVKGIKYSEETGGLSGAPLFQQSTKILQQLHEILQDKIPIIAVGGIMSADKALTKFSAGASLVQLYTGFIYEGPMLIEEIANKFPAQSFGKT